MRISLLPNTYHLRINVYTNIPARRSLIAENSPASEMRLNVDLMFRNDIDDVPKRKTFAAWVAHFGNIAEICDVVNFLRK